MKYNLWLGFSLLALLCWGNTSVLFHKSAAKLGSMNATLVQFIGYGLTGIAVFFISEIMLRRGKSALKPTCKNWIKPALWTALALTVAATAMNIALRNGPGPVVQVPVVYAVSTVVSVLVAIKMERLRPAHWLFYAGVAFAISGLPLVYFNNPSAFNLDTGMYAELGLYWWLLALLPVVLVWGIYGHLTNELTKVLGGYPLRTIGVIGFGYLSFGVVLLIAVGRIFPEHGSWRLDGAALSFVSGVISCLGGLAVFYANRSGPGTGVTMPLIFGGAPIFSTAFAILWNPPYQAPSPILLFGVSVVAAGLFTIYRYKPAQRK